jgi:NAD+ synthetase
MALSNKFGWLLVASGNKSELSVGYATLYGDMAGGFALLKDVFKTDVFRLARHLNERAGRELIPLSTIDRAPSAELREGQLDADSLPPYPELDRVLEAYVEEDRSLDELSADGFDPDVVARAVALIDRAEYKRRQARPGCVCVRRRSAATGGRRSRTAGGAEPLGEVQRPRRHGRQLRRREPAELVCLREVRRLEALDAHEVHAGEKASEAGLVESPTLVFPEQRAELEADEADLLVELAA